ncbi:hypothetical protein ACNKHV_22230 [Shigella flexneri]
MAERTYPGGTKSSSWPAGQPTTTVTTTGGNAAATVAATGWRTGSGDMPYKCTANNGEP